ncbi:Hypothetical predicted protein [Podarcis lilfordi]|uniref:Uncharacterized protein n=1 Tax=Podarcis lilfordi TaxID=74358 RepID=A0AA35PLI8_9SAUR|nr:Hypothetical predicted protein [Podarcis lilfordi]
MATANQSSGEIPAPVPMTGDTRRHSKVKRKALKAGRGGRVFQMHAPKEETLGHIHGYKYVPRTVWTASHWPDCTQLRGTYQLGVVADQSYPPTTQGVGFQVSLREDLISHRN